MKYLKLLFLIISIPIFGQNNNSRVSTYILDNEQAKFIVFDKNDNYILKGDFENDNFKSKDYLFKKGIVYYKKDSVGFYSEKNISFKEMKFKYRTPMFKNNFIENIISKKKICDVEEDENYNISVSFKVNTEALSTLKILTYWSNIMKINKILNKRSKDSDFILGFVTGSITNN